MRQIHPKITRVQFHSHDAKQKNIESMQKNHKMLDHYKQCLAGDLIAMMGSIDPMVSKDAFDQMKIIDEALERLAAAINGEAYQDAHGKLGA